MSNTLSDIATTCLGALLRASWQGGLALVAVWAVCALLPGLSPRLRCWLWRFAYARLLLALFWATPVEVPVLPAPTAPTAPPIARSFDPGSLRAVRTPDGRSGLAMRSPAPEVRPTTAGAPTSASAVAVGASRVPWELAVMAIWLAGAAAASLSLRRQRWESRRLRGCAFPVRDPEVVRSWRELCVAVKVFRPVELGHAPDVESPLLLAGRPPLVLLPSTLLVGWREGRLRLMLAHELAHLRRGDLLWSWLPALAHVLFFFHPAVWLAAREWRLAQEMACDELALEATAAPAAEYGRMLVDLAATRRSTRPRAATAGALWAMNESPRTLERRLKAMKQFGKLSARGAALSGAALVVAGAAILVPYRVTAQDAPEKDRAEVSVREKQAADQERRAEEQAARAEEQAERAEEQAERAERRALAAKEALVQRERADLVRQDRRIGGAREALQARRRELEAQKRALEAEIRALKLRERNPRDDKGYSDLDDGSRLRELRRGRIRGEAGDVHIPKEAIERALAEIEKHRPELEAQLDMARGQIEKSLAGLEARRGAGADRAALDQAREELARAKKELDSHRGDILGEIDRAKFGILKSGRNFGAGRDLPNRAEIEKMIGPALDLVPGQVERALAEARREVSREFAKMKPEERERAAKAFRDHVPGETARALAEARRSLAGVRNQLSPELRERLQQVLEQVERELRSFGEDLRKELDKPQAK
jgi:beta-lactamase regulating signal transducer with metallopeptidase domain